MRDLTKYCKRMASKCDMMTPSLLTLRLPNNPLSFALNINPVNVIPKIVKGTMGTRGGECHVG